MDTMQHRLHVMYVRFLDYTNYISIFRIVSVIMYSILLDMNVMNINFLWMVFFTECNSFASTFNYIFKFIFPRVNSSDSFRLDFAAKGNNDAILALSEQDNEDNLYEVRE